MSSILSRDGEETRASSTDVGEQLVRAVTLARDRSVSGRSSGSSEGTGRTFLLIDLGVVGRYLLGDRGSATEAVESSAEQLFDTRPESRSDEGGGGRGTLATLFVLGAVAGLGYVLQRRMGSVDEVVDRATERAGSVADRTEMRSGEAAGQAEEAAGEAADRIEETGETVAEQVESGSEEVAERVREGGEEAADTVQEGGEEAADRMEEAGERAEEMADESEATADEGEEGEGTTEEESEA